MTDPGTAKRTKKLLIGALAFLLGLPLSAALHGVLDVLSGMASEMVMLSRLLEYLGVAFFLIALIVCPAGLAICLVAAVLDRLTVRWKTRPRWILLILVSVIAAVAGPLLFEKLLSMAPMPSMGTIERDEAAGLNGSFEVVESGLPVNWNVYLRAVKDGRAEFSIDTSDFTNGARSVRFVIHAIDPSRQRWRNPGLFSKSDAEEGRTYDVTFWLKNQGCSIWVRINSEEPLAQITESTENPEIKEFIGPDGTGEGEWHQFAYTYTVPSHYGDIRFELLVVTPGTLWIDDFRIEPTQGR